MAVFVFGKNSDGVANSIYRIAESQEVYDTEINFSDDLYDLVTVSDADFNSVKLGLKHPINKTGSNVTYEENVYFYDSQEDLSEEISKQINDLNHWLESNTTSSLRASVETYKNYLNGLDVTTIINDANPELNKSIQQYAEDNAVTAFSFLQLF